VNRSIRISTDKLWRRGAILLKSSFGGLCSFYLNLFCKLAEKTDARLLLAHEDEFLFEVDDGNLKFEKVLEEVNQWALTEPACKWHVTKHRERWVQPFLNAEDFVTGRWI